MPSISAAAVRSPFVCSTARRMWRRSTSANGAISSLKRFKDDVREVATGFECGIGLDADDIAEGDVIECYQMVAEQAAH